MYPWNLEVSSLSDIQGLSYEVAVLPIGATEPHGMHLPYGTDAMHAPIVAELACRQANENGARTIRLPGMPYGVDANMREFPFAMNVRQDTVNMVVRDLIDSLIYESESKHALRKIVIVNGHGGNEFKSLVREYSARRDVFVSLIDWWTVASDVAAEVFENPGDHADEMETSVALHLFDRLVHTDRMGDGSVRETDFDAINRGWVKISRPWHLLTNDSGCGDPRKGTAEKGERYIRETVDRIVGFLKDLSDIPFDENFPYSRQMI
jgi:creatinine amidohydrolase